MYFPSFILRKQNKAAEELALKETLQDAKQAEKEEEMRSSKQLGEDKQKLGEARPKANTKGRRVGVTIAPPSRLSQSSPTRTREHGEIPHWFIKKACIIR